MNWRVIWEYLLARAKEKTTWAGLLTLLASGAGVAIAPEHAELITAIGTSVAGLLLMGMKEKGSEK